MSIVSYAQNFEDVMLWRALGHITQGYYIDVGAQDPIVDSVSLAFYEKGWRGLHVEPTPHYAELLRQQRPGDTVVQAAIGNGPAEIKFFEVPHTGISTADASIAEQHRQRGFDVHEISVRCVPLSAIFKSCAAAEIHWLKVDVEGFEAQVLKSWGKSKTRPWIVVVESTLPLTQTQSHASWEPVLLGYGYELVYFDGLNRYYLSVAHMELKSAFATPPNVFDDFSLNGTASAPFHRLLNERHKEELNGLAAQTTDKQIWSRIEKMLAEGNETTQQALERLLRNQEDRTQEIATQLTHVLQQAAKDSALLALRHEEQVELLRREGADQEIIHAKRLQVKQEELARIQDSHKINELKLTGQVVAAQQQIENLLLTKAQREQEIAAALSLLQQQTAKEAILLKSRHNEQKELLRQEIINLRNKNEQLIKTGRDELAQINAMLLEARLKTETLLHTQVKREQDIAMQLHDVAQKMEREKHALVQHHADEIEILLNQSAKQTLEIQQLVQKTDALNQRLDSLVQTSTKRERSLIEQMQADKFIANQHSKDQIRAFTQREQELRLHYEKSEASLLQRLNTSEQLRLKLSARQDTIESAFTQERATYVNDLQHLSSIVAKQNNALVRRKSTLWQRYFSPFNTFRQGLEAEQKMNIGSITTMQPVYQIAYQPVFKVKADGIYDLDDFQHLYDRNFVHAAYVSILRREPDQAGEAYYLERIRKGVSKNKILAQFQKSSEAKKHKTYIAGLKAALVIENICAVPVVGRVAVAILFLSNIKNHLQDLRALENHMVRMAEETQLTHQNDIAKIRAMISNLK